MKRCAPNTASHAAPARRPRRSIGFGAALVLSGSALLGCAGDDDIEASAVNPANPTTAATSTGAGSANPGNTAAPGGTDSGNGIPGGAESPLPKVRVRNVVSGELVDLSTLLPGDKPLLIWFWAPY